VTVLTEISGILNTGLDREVRSVFVTNLLRKSRFFFFSFFTWAQAPLCFGCAFLCARLIALTLQTLSICVSLCESGVNPEALAAVIRELRREQAAAQSKAVVRCPVLKIRSLEIFFFLSSNVSCGRTCL
jgi:hypothetical protein